MCHNTIVIKVILWFTSLSTAEQQDSLVTMLTIAKKNSLTITQYKECEWRISAIVSCSCDQLYKKRERERERARPTAIKFPGKEPAKHKITKAKLT